ncbi:MAG: hypothetical protein A2234_05405 [Elusimicrobia bacterium RIFOXYA2_FULL_58_8]|nr:MAG: hypothetical protein A2285_02215 [Elusimicrobia bacterium RIFOXYA12_FULL_57_11]OGS17331.1 MAG: hypothetical protein A2234_05405 [Elusimicrobia bacterium RIFOXYA2_FULL_58_8]
MKKTILFSIMTLALCAAFAQNTRAAEVKPAGKNCADCPMHKKAAAGAAKTINCPETKNAQKHDCGKNCGGKICPEKITGATASVTNTQAGVEVSISSKNRQTVAKIQQAAVPHYAGKNNKCAGCPTTVPGAETTFENTPAGILVKITGKTPETVKLIQAAAAKEFVKTDGKADAKVSKKYACPMNCAASDKPGKCPKCGMPMEEKK